METTIIQNKKTEEKFVILSHSWVGLIVGGTYIIKNMKTKEISNITGWKLKRKFIVIE